MRSAPIPTKSSEVFLYSYAIHEQQFKGELKPSGGLNIRVIRCDLRDCSLENEVKLMSSRNFWPSFLFSHKNNAWGAAKSLSTLSLRCCSSFESETSLENSATARLTCIKNDLDPI